MYAVDGAVTAQVAGKLSQVEQVGPFADAHRTPCTRRVVFYLIVNAPVRVCVIPDKSFLAIQIVRRLLARRPRLICLGTAVPAAGSPAEQVNQTVVGLGDILVVFADIVPLVGSETPRTRLRRTVSAGVRTASGVELKVTLRELYLVAFIVDGEPSVGVVGTCEITWLSLSSVHAGVCLVGMSTVERTAHAACQRTATVEHLGRCGRGCTPVVLAIDGGQRTAVGEHHAHQLDVVENETGHIQNRELPAPEEHSVEVLYVPGVDGGDIQITQERAVPEHAGHILHAGVVDILQSFHPFEGREAVLALAAVEHIGKAAEACFLERLVNHRFLHFVGIALKTHGAAVQRLVELCYGRLLAVVTKIVVIVGQDARGLVEGGVSLSYLGREVTLRAFFRVRKGVRVVDIVLTVALGAEFTDQRNAVVEHL